MATKQLEAPLESEPKLLPPPAPPPLLPAVTGGANIWLQIAVGGAIALVLGMGALQLLPLLARSIALLILAISIAAALAPLVGWLSRWLPRILAIVVVYVALLLFFAFIVQLIIPTLIVQIQRIGSRLPEFIELAQLRLGSAGLGAADIVDTLTPQLGELSSTLVALPLTLLSSILEIFLVLVMSMYWLLISFSLRSFFLSLFPPERHERVQSILREMGSAMGGYIRATFINGLTMGLFTYLGLALIGVDYPLVLGLLAGLLELVPIVGPMIAGVLVVLVAVLNSPTQALIALAYMFLLQQFESHILVPNIMRSQTEISPLVVILALFAGSSIGGLWGALIAIPLVSALQVLMVKVIIPEIRRHTGARAPS